MARLPSRPRRVSGPHTYREPDTDSEDLQVEQTIVRTDRPARSNRRTQTYRETSSTDSDGSQRSSNSSPQSSNPATLVRNNTVRRRSQRHVRSRQPRSARTTALEKTPLRSFKRRKIGPSANAAVKTRKASVSNEVDIPTNTNAPPWQTLGYHILLKIMEFASQPLYLSAFKKTDSTNWLLGVSQLCRSFHEAAITALLREPPLLPAYHAHGLIDILKQEPIQLSTSYRTKIKSLNLEVRYLLVKKSGIELDELLRYTPMLSRLRIFHAHDEMIGKAIWAEPSVTHFKWSYDTLFDCLDHNNIRLKSFEWNGRFKDTISAMIGAHQRPCLEKLEEVSIVNFNFTDKQEAERVVARDDMISSLAKLRNLQVVEFYNVTILDNVSMPQIPTGLRVLRIANCLSLTSESVGTYLARAGVSLYELDLAGNQVMDLSFMPRLADSCPHLQRLAIDLEYEDCSSYHDRNPLYDELLPTGSPTWPLELVSIVIGPLRSLAVADAENFYSSLIDAAPSLPFLRILKIRTLLKDASWRDRAQLRSKWVSLFHTVFAVNKVCKPTKLPRAEKPQDSRDSKQRKSVRLQEQEDAGVSEDIDESALTNEDLPAMARQNRCEIVEFELSDQRPAQEQFREVDFLDSEVSGDEEWTGRDVALSNGMYAW